MRHVIQDPIVTLAADGTIAQVEVTFGRGFFLRLQQFNEQVTIEISDNSEVAVEFIADEALEAVLWGLARQYPHHVFDSSPFGVTLPVHRLPPDEQKAAAAQSLVRSAGPPAVPDGFPHRPISPGECCRDPEQEGATFIHLGPVRATMAIGGDLFEMMTCEVCGVHWLVTNRTRHDEDEEGVIYWLRVDDDAVGAMFQGGNLEAVEAAIPSLLTWDSEGSPPSRGMPRR